MRGLTRLDAGGGGTTIIERAGRLSPNTQRSGRGQRNRHSGGFRRDGDGTRTRFLEP